jgi:hypothetical protein
VIKARARDEGWGIPHISSLLTGRLNRDRLVISQDTDQLKRDGRSVGGYAGGGGVWESLQVLMLVCLYEEVRPEREFIWNYYFWGPIGQICHLAAGGTGGRGSEQGSAAEGYRSMPGTIEDSRRKTTGDESFRAATLA